MPNHTTGKVLGVTKVVHGDACQFFEFEVFEQRGKDLVVQPYPGGKPAASFKLTTLDGQRAVFSNPANDWPQHIEYSRPDADTLQFTLSAVKNGKRRAETYRLKRVK